MNDDILLSFLASLRTTPRAFFDLLPLMRQILDLVPVRFYLKDIHHRIIFANKECIKALDCRNIEEVLGKTDRDFFTPLHADQAWLDEQKLFENPDLAINGKEEPEVWQDGRQTWVKTWKWPWLDEKNEHVIGIVGLSAEITTSKDTYDQYRLAAANAPAGLWHRNLETDLTWFSPRWKSLLGYQDDDFPNSYEHLLKCIHPDDVERVKKTTADHLEGNTRVYHCEFRMRHKNGNWKWIQSQGAKSHDEMGRPVFAGSHADITEVKEKLLFYEYLIDSVPTLIFVKDDQHRFQFVNKALANAFGIAKEEFIGKTDAHVNPNAEQVAKFQRDDRTVLWEKEEMEIEEEDLFLEKTNSHVILATKKRRILSILDDPQNCKPLVLGVSVDTTPLRRARDEILKGNQQLDFLMKNVPDGIFIKDRECKFVRVTDTLAALAGCTASELIGKSDWDLFGDEDYFRDSMNEDLEIVRTKIGKNNILRLTPTRKGSRYRLISKVPVLDGQGNVIYIMGISKDVHDIANPKVLLDSVLNTIPQFVFVKNYTGHYVLANRRFAERHNETPESIVGKTDADFWSSEQAIRFQRDDRDVIETNRQRLFYEEEQVFADGRRRKLETSKIPLPDAAGKPNLVLGIYDDVTERLDKEGKLAGFQLRELQIHGKIIRSLSHCLKHWLAPLEGSMFHMLIDMPTLKDSPCYQRLRRQVAIVKESIVLATHYASLQSIRQVKKQPIEINALVRDIADVVANFEENIPVRIALAPREVRVLGEPAHLRNAIVQIITNAKHVLKNRPGAEINVSVEETTEHCNIYVSDNGPGIPEKLRPVLFDLSDVKLGLNPKNTGLGLHYVRCVAEAHGGTVEELSLKKADRGAKFVFQLPRTPGPLE